MAAWVQQSIVKYQWVRHGWVEATERREERCVGIRWKINQNQRQLRILNFSDGHAHPNDAGTNPLIGHKGAKNIKNERN